MITAAVKRLTTAMSVGLRRSFGPRRTTPAVLMYHRVTEAVAGLSFPSWNVTPDHFGAQIDGLLSRGYSILPLADIVARLKAGDPLPPRATALTFDDGYGCIAEHVGPMLSHSRLPATVFLATAYIGTQAPFAFDGWGRRHADMAPPSAWRPLTWEECRKAKAEGWLACGSHSHTHDNSAGDLAAWKTDVIASRDTLLSHLGPGDHLFAYPGGARSLGQATLAMAQVVRDAGFTAAFTTAYGGLGATADPYLLGRYEVTDDDDAESLAAKLDGWNDWVGLLREVYRLPRLIWGARFGQ